MKAGFRLPFDTETARRALTAAVDVEIIRRGRKTAQSPEFERQMGEISRWLSEQPTTGLLLCGGVGNGKTTFLDAICNLYNVYGSQRQGNMYFRRLDAIELNRMTGDSDIDGLKRHPLLAIDDFGTENISVMTYGNAISPVTELIYARYQNRMTTIITTNLTPSQIRQRYGERIADRFNEMMTVVLFKNQSYR